MQAPERLPWADIARGIGIILVVFGHVLRGAALSDKRIPDPTFQILDHVVYSFHMPLFFLVSGWFTAQSLERHGPRATAVGRINTLVWPYVVWTWLQGTVEVLLNRWTRYDTTWQTLATFLWRPHAQFWFLYILFWSALALVAAWSVAGQRAVRWMWLVAFVLWLFHEQFAPWPVFQQFSVHSLWFGLGAYYAGSGWQPDRRQRYLLPVASMVFCAAHAAAAVLKIDPVRPGVFGVATAASGIAVVLGIATRLPDKVARIFGSLGRASLGIYVMHILVGSGARIILTKLAPTTPVSMGVLVATVLAIAIPWAATLWLDKHAPWLFRIPKMKQRPPRNRVGPGDHDSSR
jgi:fucose 4-O-acetylase-like acetyltransferase